MAAAMAALAAISPLNAAQAPVEGRRVAEVRVVYESGAAAKEPIPLLPLAAGKVFDFADERESLRALYRMGDYSDIRVAATLEPEGLRVDFIVQQNYYNNVTSIDGLKSPPSAPAALASLRMALGEPFRESSLQEGVGRLEDVLHSEGLYLAKVTWSLEPHSDTREMNILVHVDSGPRARIDGISIQNQTPYSDQLLLRRSKLSSKSELTSARLSRASDRLKSYLVDRGYLGAGALIKPGAYDPQTNRVPLSYSVVAGPLIRVEVGGARLSKGERRKLLPIYAEGAVDEDLLQEGRRNIRDYFQRQGYFDADVQVSSRQQGKESLISYEVARGDRFRLAGIGFDGNHYFPADLLSRRLELQPAAFASSGRFSQQLLRDDTESIRSVYASNGFRDAQVTSTVDSNYRGKKNNLFVTFHVSEGPQVRIASLKIDGNHAIDTAALLGVIGSTPGEPYSEADVASDRNNVLAMYYNDGYPEAHFEEDVLPRQNPDEVDLVYHLTEGTQIRVSQVLLTGYQYTRPGVIARQVVVKPGGPLREGDVVETQRRLYNLGVFNRVQIEPQNPDGSDPLKTVVVDTEEGDRYTIGYGFGFEVQELAGSGSNPSATTLAASPRGIFEIARSNMFGRAQTLSFKARASTLEYRSGLSYTADRVFNLPSFSLQLTGYADKTQDVDTFTSTRVEGGAELIEKLSPASSLAYRYFYRRVEASALKVSVEQIPLLSQPTLVSGFGLAYARDRRDNPSDAAHGSFNTADVSIASTTLGSSASFFRGLFQNSSYYSLGRSFVFARSTRFGIEHPLGNTVGGISQTFNPAQCTATAPPPAITTDVIPLPERIFAGGGTSIRGFSLNQAGPRDPCTGFPIGGLGMLIFNQELHFPMKLPIVGNRLGGTVFYDGGNVYSSVSNFSLRWKPPSLTNLDYFSHTIGFGLRYPTAVGPVRVDFAYQLNPAAYQAFNTTTQQLESFRLPHFQFFFNIGPVF